MREGRPGIAEPFLKEKGLIVRVTMKAGRGGGKMGDRASISSITLL